MLSRSGIAAAPRTTNQQRITSNQMGLFDVFDDDPEHRLDIIGRKGGGRTDYAVEATGPIYGDHLDASAAIGEKRVVDHVNGGTDTIGYDGTIKGIAFGEHVGDYRLERDGQHKWPFHLNERTIRLEARDAETPYRITASEDGRLRRSGDLSGEDELFNSKTTAEGAMAAGGSDTWYLSGGLESIDSNLGIDAFIDGEHRVIEGNAPIGTVSYDG